MGKIGVTHSLIESLRVTFVGPLCYTMSSMRKKIRFLSFYLLYTHENEFSFAWMTLYKNRTTKITRSDPMNEWVTPIFLVLNIHLDYKMEKLKILL